jgi:hypothetical protein
MTSALPALLRLFAILFLLVLTTSAWATDSPSVGMVTKVENEAKVVSSGGAATAVVGTIVHMKDTLRTGAKGRLQVTFRDNTALTLGENATVVIDRYVFDPDAGIGEAALDATKGAFRLATGRLKEMREKTITVSTPVAALAVRGTDFWGGPIQGQYGVLLVSGGPLGVHNEAGAVMLAKSGEGTDIDPLKGGGAPGRPYVWPPEKVALALAATNFAVALGPASTTTAVAAAAAAAVAIAVTVPSSRPRPASP